MPYDKNDFETCLVCGNRSRKQSCLVCSGCTQHFSRLLEKSAIALSSRHYDKVLPIEDKFQFVIDMAEGKFPDPESPDRIGTIQMLKEKATRAENAFEAQENALWERARNEIKVNASGRKIGRAVVEKAVESKFAQIKDGDEDLKAMGRKAHGFRLAVEIAERQLEEVKRKRADFLAEQEAEDDQDVAAAG